jgi:hypothetical protein
VGLAFINLAHLGCPGDLAWARVTLCIFTINVNMYFSHITKSSKREDSKASSIAQG